MPLYYDIKPVIEKGLPFNLIIGGRGIGKTYSALQYCMEENICHAYIRRLQSEIDLCVNPEINPYKELNKKLERDYNIKKKKDFAIIHEGEEARGFAFALSTFSSIRGASFHELDLGIFDEFVAPKEKRCTIKNEADAFFNLYETINRNRELEGRKPFQVLLLSNAVSMASPILVELGLVPVLEMMQRKGQRRYTDYDRGLFIDMPFGLKISDEKRQTALYRLTMGTRFNDHAIDNHFAYDSFYNVKKQNILEYTPVCSVLDIYIYRHKSNANLYACTVRADCVRYTEDTLSLFHRNHYLPLREAYISGRFLFDSFMTKTVLDGLLK